MNQLLDYFATYPNDGITYHARAMILSGHSNAGYLNESRTRSRADTHIFLSKDKPMPRLNVPILTIAEIIKFVMSSATKAKLSAMFITSNNMVPFRQTIIKIRWPQPLSPISCDYSTSIVVTNETIIPRKTN